MSFKPNSNSNSKGGYQRPAVAGNTAVAATNNNNLAKSGSSVQPAAVLKYSEATPEGAEQSKMVRITGLFTAKSGNGYTATLKESITIPAGARLFLFVNSDDTTK